MKTSEIPIALSVGCPSGIGPEIAIEACIDSPSPILLVGDRQQLQEIAAARGVSLEKHTIVQPGSSLTPVDRYPGKPTSTGGAAQLQWIDAALDLVTSKSARALVTGPVSKKMIASSGAPGSSHFTGHTEYLQQKLGADEVVMAFWSKTVSTALVTTHLPLREVADALSPERVGSATFWLAWLLVRLGSRQPRIAVASLNPHAGEDGLLGQEEEMVLKPGITFAKQRAETTGITAQFFGPIGAETAFRQGAAGGFDGVVAMYHDQATIPMKLLGFGESVNVSLGLPIVRTSVDHGTGYEIAGTGKADARGLRLALELAHRMTSPADVTEVSEAILPS